MTDNISLDDLEIYQLAMSIGEAVWNTVDKWKSFDKTTTGEQLIRAADSIAANIAEGYGRYFYKDRKQFYYYSRVSLLETKTWLIKSYNRKLIDNSLHDELMNQLKQLHFKLNVYIKKIKQNVNIKSSNI